MAWNRRKKVRFYKGLWVGRLLGVSVLVVCAALWYVWLRVQMVNVGYQIRDAEKRLVVLKKENQISRMKIAQMKSPKHIEAMIRTKAMDLTATKHWQVVVLPKEPLVRPIRSISVQPQEPSLLAAIHQTEASGRLPIH